MPLGAYIYSQIIGTINNKIIILLDINRKRKNKNMAIVTADEMLNQLHLDVSEKSQIQSLINFAGDYIVSTTDRKATLEQIIARTNENIVNQAIRSITESLYFNSIESQGFTIQAKVLLNSIRNLYGA